MENFNYQTLLKLEKMNKESGAPTIFNIIQDSLRDLRTTRKIIKINEDSKSTVMTENQEIHISESTVDSDDEKTIQIPLSDEKDKQIPNRTQPKIKKILKNPPLKLLVKPTLKMPLGRTRRYSAKKNKSRLAKKR